MVKKKCQCIVFTLGSHVLWQVYLHTRKEKKKKEENKNSISYQYAKETEIGVCIDNYVCGSE